MLLLARGVNETLVIGDEVAVTVVDIMGNQVMIGINAPIEVTVQRKEIHDRIQAKKHQKNGTHS